MRTRLVLFGKRPREGRVKTRLSPALSPARTVLLYRAFLEDQLRFLAGFAEETRTEWCADGPPDPAVDGHLPVAGLELSLQGDGDLGQRLQRAFRRSHHEGTPITVVIGADSPTLPASTVRRAFSRLEAGSLAVVAPAVDGGYVLIGMRRPVAGLLEGVPWGGPEVLQTTRSRARGLGLTLDELDPWYDVDDLQGLRRLWEELTHEAGRRRAPATARCLLDLDLARVL